MNKKNVEFNKRFANGKQFIRYTKDDNIIEENKDFFWQQQEVYNHIEPIIMSIKAKLKNKDIEYTEKQFDEYFYGENSLVSLLIPTQRAYNAIKNQKSEFLNRLSLPNLVVEDGSINIDNLEEENMYAGKILVYRQGAKKPETLNEDINKYDVYEKEEQRLLEEFSRLVGDIDFRIFMFEKWVKEYDKRVEELHKLLLGEQQ